MKDSPGAGQISEGDIYYSRNNVALARSQKVLQSWLPAKLDTPADQDDEDEGDFEAMDEAAGLGTSKAKDDDSIQKALRTNRASQDKLLEHLLGKKAAEAKKKSLQEARKTAHGLSKPVPSVKQLKPVPTQSDDEEEEGRAAAFSSKRKRRDNKTPAYVAAGGRADDVLVQDAEPPDPREDLATVVELVDEQTVEDVVKPNKRKAGSYLDEVLASKAKKKNKKKGKGGAK